jgi:hypothetical protein
LVVPGLLLLVGFLTFNFGTVGIRNTSQWSTPHDQYIPIDDAKVAGMYHSVKIQGSKLTADEMFDRVSRLSERNLFPVQAYGNVRRAGDEVSFDMRQDSLWGNVREFGQGDFPVRINRYDASQRYFVARTMGGHPLAAYRRWDVKQLPNGDLLVETFSVEHPVTWLDSTKMRGGGMKDMGKTWTNLLLDLATLSKGDVVRDGDTVLDGREYGNAEALQRKPLVQGGDHD